MLCQIYLMWIEQRTITLRMLGSRSAFPSYKQVSALIDKADDGNTDAQAEIAKLRKIMEESDYGDDDSELTLWAEVLDSVDKHALDAFDTIRDSIDQMTPTYVMRLSSYRQGIINSMRNKWSINANKDYSQNENEILQHLDRVVARVALFLTPKEGETHAPEPLLGGFMMDYAWSTFNKLKLGLAEVSISIVSYNSTHDFASPLELRLGYGISKTAILRKYAHVRFAQN